MKFSGSFERRRHLLFHTFPQQLSGASSLHFTRFSFQSLFFPPVNEQKEPAQTQVFQALKTRKTNEFSTKHQTSIFTTPLSGFYTPSNDSWSQNTSLFQNKTPPCHQSCFKVKLLHSISGCRREMSEEIRSLVQAWLTLCSHQERKRRSHWTGV